MGQIDKWIEEARLIVQHPVGCVRGHNGPLPATFAVQLQKRVDSVTVRVNEDEHDKIKIMAAAMGMSKTKIAEYLLALGLQDAKEAYAKDQPHDE